MAGNPKVLIGEKDGQELLDYAEHLLLAEDVPFDNTDPSFSSDNVQAAIIEAKSTAISLPRLSVSATHNAAMLNGQLVGVSSLVNNPLVVPVSSTLAEITFYQGGGATKDGQYRFYKNTETAPNLFFTWTLDNTTSAVAEDGTDYTSPTFGQGDLLLIYYDGTINNHRDVSLVNYLQAIE